MLLGCGNSVASTPWNLTVAKFRWALIVLMGASVTLVDTSPGQNWGG